MIMFMGHSCVKYVPCFCFIFVLSILCVCMYFSSIGLFVFSFLIDL